MNVSEGCLVWFSVKYNVTLTKRFLGFLLTQKYHEECVTKSRSIKHKFVRFVHLSQHVDAYITLFYATQMTVDTNVCITLPKEFSCDEPCQLISFFIAFVRYKNVIKQLNDFSFFHYCIWPSLLSMKIDPRCNFWRFGNYYLLSEILSFLFKTHYVMPSMTQLLLESTNFHSKIQIRFTRVRWDKWANFSMKR